MPYTGVCIPNTIPALLFSCFSLTFPELEFSTKKNPKQLLKSLETYVSRSLVSTADGIRQASSLSISSGRAGEEINFMGICDLQVELEGEARLV